MAVDPSSGEDVVVTRRHSKENLAEEQSDVRRLVGRGATAVRRLHAATTPEPADPVIGLNVDQINRRFAAACAAPASTIARTLHGQRETLNVRISPPPANNPIQRVGGLGLVAQLGKLRGPPAERLGRVHIESPPACHRARASLLAFARRCCLCGSGLAQELGGQERQENSFGYTTTRGGWRTRSYE